VESLCKTCVSNIGGHCNWAQACYPETLRCNHHIAKVQSSILLAVDNTKKETPPPPVPVATEFTAHSKTEPNKCLYYAKLP
jgi:hypothetical protein